MGPNTQIFKSSPQELSSVDADFNNPGYLCQSQLEHDSTRENWAPAWLITVIYRWGTWGLENEKLFQHHTVTKSASSSPSFSAPGSAAHWNSEPQTFLKKPAKWRHVLESSLDPAFVAADHRQQLPVVFPLWPNVCSACCSFSLNSAHGAFLRMSWTFAWKAAELQWDSLCVDTWGDMAGAWRGGGGGRKSRLWTQVSCQLCYQLSLWPWASCSTSSCLSSLTSPVRVIIIAQAPLRVVTVTGVWRMWRLMVTSECVLRECQLSTGAGTGDREARGSRRRGGSLGNCLFFSSFFNPEDYRNLRLHSGFLHTMIYLISNHYVEIISIGVSTRGDCVVVFM